MADAMLDRVREFIGVPAEPEDTLCERVMSRLASMKASEKLVMAAINSPVDISAAYKDFCIKRDLRKGEDYRHSESEAFSLSIGMKLKATDSPAKAPAADPDAIHVPTLQKAMAAVSEGVSSDFLRSGLINRLRALLPPLL